MSVTKKMSLPAKPATIAGGLPASAALCGTGIELLNFQRTTQ
jgi:hypothetical protein